jgi:hypothetical protein
MPAIETRFTAASDGGKEASDAAAKCSSDRCAPAHDFDSVMQATLAPRSPGTATKNIARSEKNPSPGSLAPIGTPDSRRGEKSPGAKIPGGIADDKASSKTTHEDENSPDLNATTIAGETPGPLPAFLALPLFFSSAWSLSANNMAQSDKTGATAASGKILAADSPADPNATAPGSMAPANSPVKDSKSSPVLDTKTELPGVDSTDHRQNVMPQKGTTVAAEVASEKMTAKPAAILIAPMSPLGNASAQLAVPPNTTSSATSDSQMVANPPLTTPPGVAQGLGTAFYQELTTQDTGTGVAITDPSMKNPQNMNKVAGMDVKVLPVGENGEADQKNLPLPLLVPTVRASDSHGSDLNFGYTNGDSPAAAETASNLQAVDLPLLSDTRMRALDRANDMVALHSMRLIESKTDVLSVMIKPAVGTELSLELRQHANGVEARAALVRGDHEFLSQHWSELQQRLEQRGIKLGPLGGDAFGAANDQGQFQKPHFSQDEDDAQQASAFAEFAATGQGGGATARLAAIHDGWESWA